MKRNPRGVIDTNVLISAALNKTGLPRAALLYVVERGILLASEETFHELETRLWRAKFDPYLQDEVRVAFLDWIYGLSRFIDITEPIEASRDPSDDKFLELAVSGEADVIISGDKHLKELHPFQGIPVLAPHAFLEGVGEGRRIS